MVAYRLRRPRRLMLAACVGLLAATAAVLWVGLTAPLAVSMPPQVVPGDTPPAAGPSGKRIAPLEVYRQVASRNLRKPLYDVVKTEDTPPPPPPPKLTLVLVGTVVEPGFTCAMLRTAEGKVKLVKLGQSLGEAQLIKVTRDSAHLRYYGDIRILTIAKDTR